MAHVPHCPPKEFDGQKVAGTTPSAHLDMVRELDLQVKRIVDALKVNGVYNNTLLVFLSDNGGLQVDKDTMNSGHRSNGGFGGAKNSPLEGGHRTPFIVVWPEIIKPGVSDEPVISHDMLATFAALVGTHVPEDQALDSNNLLPLLTGKGEFKQRKYLVQQAGADNEVMIRDWPWKLIIQSDHKCSKWEPKALYNLKDNPSEKWTGNLIGNPEYSQLIKQMKKKYLEIREGGERTAPYNF
jgi:arylsulfatase A-like enzyme